MHLSESQFSQLIKSAPLVSIDLCIVRDNKILLGKRINQPAKDFFFVPGGRIFKSELISSALQRVLKDELGFSLKKEYLTSVINIGIYEHFYNENFLGNSEFSTHYIVLPYLIPYELLIKVNKDSKIDQHSEYIWIEINNEENYSYKIHPYTLKYFKNIFLKDIK